MKFLHLLSRDHDNFKYIPMVYRCRTRIVHSQSTEPRYHDGIGGEVNLPTFEDSTPVHIGIAGKTIQLTLTDNNYLLSESIP